MRRIIFVILGITFFVISSLSARQKPTLSPGDRVRLWACTLGLQQTIVTVVAVESDSLRFSHPSHALPFAVSWACLSKVEVSRGPGSSKSFPGVLTCLAVGAVVGGAIGYATSGGSTAEDDYRGLGALVFGGVGAATGALVGLMIGSGRSGERWQNVPLHFQAGASVNGEAKLVLAIQFNF